MSFNPGGGGGISGATDVFLSNPQDDQVLTYNSTSTKWQNQTFAAGSSGTLPRAIVVVSSSVASALGYTSNPPFTYVCSGTNDQNTINTALQQASLSHGIGAGIVMLSGGIFNISGSIIMYPATTLAGSGAVTILKSISMASGQGMIRLLDKHTHLTTVRDLTLDGNYASGGSSHGIYYLNSDVNGDGNMSTYLPDNNPDSSHQIMNLFISNFTTGTRHGIYLADNCRDARVSFTRIRSCSGSGIKFEGSSDCKITSVISIDCSQHGFDIGGASNLLINCKASYCDVDGFNITSSRTSLGNCEGQDNGRHGLYVGGADTKVAAFRADSNRRLDTTGAGVSIQSSRTDVSDLFATDRAQSVQQQTVGVAFGGSLSDVRVTGIIRLPGGTSGTYVTGTYATTSNYVHLSCVGGTMIKYNN